MSSRELAALVNSSNHLLDLRRKLSKAHAQGPPSMPAQNPVPGRLDERYWHLSRARKSALSPAAPDRIASEMYPVPNPPVVQFVRGMTSRTQGRTQTIFYG
jgi:hypothetical protein